MSTRVTVRIAARIAAALVLLSMGSVAIPQGGAAANDPGVVIASVLTAWSRADAHAIAAQYEPDGDFVSPTGDHAFGRDAIEAFYRAAFDTGYAGSAATATATHMRALSATFALIDGCWTIQPTATSSIAEPESGLFFAVLHRHDGRWWIAALREQTSARELHELKRPRASSYNKRTIRPSLSR
jgi:uncharacterized protein (TIGR02246 family)